MNVSTYSSSPNLIVVGTKSPDIRICDIKSRTTSHCLIGHKDSVICIKWATNSDHLIASGSNDGVIRLWDIRRSGCLMSLDYTSDPDILINDSNKNSLSMAKAHTSAVTGLCFSNDGRFLFSTGRDNKIRCWNMQNGHHSFIHYPNVSSRSKTTVYMAISSDDQFLYHPNGRNIHVYNSASGELLKTFSGHFDRVNCCLFHPFNCQLFSGSNDHCILIWEPLLESESNEIEQIQLEDKDRWSDEEL